MRKIFASILLALAVSSTLFSLPQRETYDSSLWPEKEITVICPWAVGGVADIVNRTLAAYVKEELGVTVLAVNELGAGGNVALTNYALSNSCPYEFILGGEGGFAIAPNIEGAEAIVFSYDDYEPVINLYSSIMVLTVSSDLGIRSFDELVSYGKDHRITVAVNGVAGAEAFLVRALFDQVALDYELVNYNGANLALRAAAKGETTVAVSHQSQALGAVEDGSLTPLIVFDDERSDNHPFEAVPSLLELGYHTYYPNTCVLLAAKGCDEQIIEKLQSAYLAAMGKKEIKDLYDSLLIEMDPMVGREYDRHIESVISIVKEAVSQPPHP